MGLEISGPSPTPPHPCSDKVKSLIILLTIPLYLFLIFLNFETTGQLYAIILASWHDLNFKKVLIRGLGVWAYPILILLMIYYRCFG